MDVRKFIRKKRNLREGVRLVRDGLFKMSIKFWVDLEMEGPTKTLRGHIDTTE